MRDIINPKATSPGRTGARLRKSKITVFDSVVEWIESAAKGAFKYYTESFVGMYLPTWEHVERQCNKVWTEGLTILSEMVSQLDSIELPEVKDRKRRVRFSEDDGDEVDYDRLRSGQPYWRTSQREEIDGPSTMTVIIDTSAPASVPTRDILWRGASAIALTKILESKGYQIELWVVKGNKNVENTIQACCLKQPGDPLDESTMIAAVSGWFYRTVVFTQIKTLNARHSGQRIVRLGSPFTPTQSDLDCLTTDENRVYSAGVFSQKGAIELMEAELSKIGERTN